MLQFVPIVISVALKILGSELVHFKTFDILKRISNIYDTVLLLLTIKLIGGILKDRNTYIKRLSSHFVEVITGFAMLLYIGSIIGVVSSNNQMNPVDRTIVIVKYLAILVNVLYLIAYVLLHPRQSDKHRSFIASMIMVIYIYFISYPLTNPESFRKTIVNLDDNMQPYIFTLRPTAVEFFLESSIEIFVSDKFKNKKTIFHKSVVFSTLKLLLSVLIPVSIFTIYVIDGTRFDTPKYITFASMGFVQITIIVILIRLIFKKCMAKYDARVVVDLEAGAGAGAPTPTPKIDPTTHNSIVPLVVFYITSVGTVIGNIVQIVIDYDNAWIVSIDIIILVGSVVQFIYLCYFKKTESRDTCIILSILNFTWWVLASVKESNNLLVQHDDVNLLLEVCSPLMVTSKFNAGIVFWEHYKEDCAAQKYVKLSEKITNNVIADLKCGKAKVVDVQATLARCKELLEEVSGLSTKKLSELTDSIMRRDIEYNMFRASIKGNIDLLESWTTMSPISIREPHTPVKYGNNSSESYLTPLLN